MAIHLKKLGAMGLAALLAVSNPIISFSGTWRQSGERWWYQEDDGTYPVNAWKWIGDKCYYFDENGWMLSNATTPDGYQVDASGAWIQSSAQPAAAMLNSGQEALEFCKQIFGERDNNLAADLYYNYIEADIYNGELYYIVEYRVFFDGAQKSSYWCHLGVAKDQSKIYQCFRPPVNKTYADTFGKVLWPK